MRLDELFDLHGITFVTEGEHHHARPGWINFDCPWCTGQGAEKWLMGYSLEKNFVHCWKCGAHSLLATVSRIIQKPARECGILLGEWEPSSLAIAPKPTGRLCLPRGLGPLLSPHKKYLRGRGFVPSEAVRRWRAQGLGLDAGRLKWRIFIPITYKRKVVSWTTRSISDNTTRYISASSEQESIPHKELLYGEEFCRHTIAVCEGPLDCWRLGLGAVATCGTSYTRKQVLKLSMYPRRVLVFDNEREAQARAHALCSLLSTFPGETYNVQLDAADPGSASRREVQLFRKAFLD